MHTAGGSIGVAAGRLQPRQKKIYSNNAVYSPAGMLMFRCSDKKLDWYLTRSLAIETTPCEGDARAAKLVFEPRGLGRNRLGDAWYLERQAERCVICGRYGIVDDDDAVQLDDREDTPGGTLTLHHVVPYQYRRFMPLEYKSHGSHDVLAVCIEDHTLYERHAEDVKRRLVVEHGAPREGIGWIKHDVGAIRGVAGALLRHTDKIPPDRVAHLRESVAKHYAVSTDEITMEMLQDALELRTLEKAPAYREHGEIVVASILAAEGEHGLDDFVRMWRRHFVETTSPKFLSPSWHIDDPVSLREGEYSPYHDRPMRTFASSPSE